MEVATENTKIHKYTAVQSRYLDGPNAVGGSVKYQKVQKYTNTQIHCSAVQSGYLGPKAVSGSGRSDRKSSLLLL